MQDLQVLVVLQGLVHHQVGGPLALVMALDTITELAVLDLDTEVLDIQVVDLATMGLSVVNIQALVVRAILQVDNMVDILEVASHRVVQEVLLKAIHPQVILLVAHLGEPHLDLIWALGLVQEHLQHLWLLELLLQDRIPLQARPLLTQRQPHLPPHLRHRRRPPPPPSRHLPIHHLLHLLNQGLRVLLLLTHGQQALPLPTIHPPTLLMAQGLPLLVEQAQVVLGPQDKDSQVVILAVVLLEATQVILEDLATLHLAILGVELLLEHLVLAILVGDLIHHPKGATLLMVIPKGHLEVIHPQAQAIRTDLKAEQWVHLVDMLLVLQVPHPPKVAVAPHGVW